MHRSLQVSCVSPLAGVLFYLLYPSFWSDVFDVLDVALPHALGKLWNTRELVSLATTPMSEKDLLENALEITVLSDSWGRVFP